MFLSTHQKKAEESEQINEDEAAELETKKEEVPGEFGKLDPETQEYETDEILDKTDDERLESDAMMESELEIVQESVQEPESHVTTIEPETVELSTEHFDDFDAATDEEAMMLQKQVL